MTTAERKKSEKLRDLEKANEDAFYAGLLAIAPEHVKKRLNLPQSEFAKQLAKNLSLVGTPHNRVGATYDEETGQLIKKEDPPEQGANYLRNQKKLDDITLFREDHPEEWGKRGMPKVIAGNVERSPRTIQKYFRMRP